jgi:hypothetical protein
MEIQKQVPELPPPEPYSGQLEFIEGLRKVIKARRRYNLLLYSTEDPSPLKRLTKASGEEYFAELEVREMDVDLARETHEARCAVTRMHGIPLPLDELVVERNLDPRDRCIVEVLLVEATSLGDSDHEFRVSCGRVARCAADWDPDKLQKLLPHFFPTGRLTESGTISTTRCGQGVGGWSVALEQDTLLWLIADHRSAPDECPDHTTALPSDIEASLRDLGIELTAVAAEGIRRMWGWLARRDVLANEWGFCGSARGRGATCLLFHGPSGTGKTLTARAISRVLGRPLRFVSATDVMDMWVGETQKKLRAAFNEAAKANAVLLLDEADALFGRRSDITRAGERIFNAEVNSALIELDRFRGVCILTTNHPDLLDPAALRRVRHKVYFGLPESETRARIWRYHVPWKAPIAADVDFGKLGSGFALTGGQIANAVLAAASAAASRIGLENGSGSISMADLESAARQESIGCSATEREKMGF